MKNYFIAIAGNIGAGKTNFSRVLAQRLGWEWFKEPVDENPYLADFYQDMKTYAFHSQVFYFARLMTRHFNLSKRESSVVQDRTFYENAEIFAKNLYEQGILSERDWQTYLDMYTAALEASQPPDLLIYLKADLPLLLDRIKARKRPAEKNIKVKYIEQLNVLYNRWITDFSLCPTLCVDLHGTNLRDSQEEQDVIIARIWEILGKDPESIENQLLMLDFKNKNQEIDEASPTLV